MTQIPPSESRSALATLAPALVLGMAALLGVQSTVAAASEHRAERHGAAVGTVSVSATLFEASPALEDMAGTAAGLALLLWLSRHSLNRAGSMLPAVRALPRLVRHEVRVHRAPSRKATISFHTGGLYGP